MAPRLLKGIAGIDEAGRGPMFGPLVVCGVSLGPESVLQLARMGVRDSKTLTARKREELTPSIRKLAQKVVVEEISAQKIDQLRAAGVTLNEIEMTSFASIAKRLSPAELYLDAADANQERFGALVGTHSGLIDKGCKVISEHKADARYTVVGAASIVAKTTRDAVIAQLHEEYEDIGSGYPSDPKSVAYLKALIDNEKELPPFVRRSWKSVLKRVQKKEMFQEELDF